MQLCDIKYIQTVLKKHGFRFSKSLGQNFLTQSWVPQQIAEASGVDAQSGALEIGPGMGCLTYALAQKAQKVVALELDRSLFPVLEETLQACQNVQVVHGDVLKTDFRAFCRTYFPNQTVHACANLPYYITTPALSALLDSKQFASITVMVQKEVAERICAPVGSRESSAFSVYVQYHAKVEYLFDVPRACFCPEPKVDSAVIRLTPYAQSPIQVKEESLFFALVKAAFGERRKVFVNAVQTLLADRMTKEQLSDFLDAQGIDRKVRGEKLTMTQLASVADFLSMHKVGNARVDA